MPIRFERNCATVSEPCHGLYRYNFLVWYFLNYSPNFQIEDVGSCHLALFISYIKDAAFAVFFQNSYIYTMNICKTP